MPGWSAHSDMEGYDPCERGHEWIGAEYRCVNGHDRCDQMYPGPDCPYCEVVNEGDEECNRCGYRPDQATSQFRTELAQMEAEQSGDLLPCGWCGLHHEQGTCKALELRRSPEYRAGYAHGWKVGLEAGYRAADRTAESWTDWADRNEERMWAIRSNGGRRDE